TSVSKHSLTSSSSSTAPQAIASMLWRLRDQPWPTQRTFTRSCGADLVALTLCRSAGAAAKRAQLDQRDPLRTRRGCGWLDRSRRGACALVCQPLPPGGHQCKLRLVVLAGARMRLTPTERDRLLLFTAAQLARARRARGLLLNVPEATALIADTVCEAARDGLRLAEAVEAGRTVLSAAEVLPGVPDIVTEVQVEAVFDDGTRLAIVSEPFRGASLGGRAPGAILPREERDDARSSPWEAQRSA